MPLPETFETVRKSIVALGTKLAIGQSGAPLPAFPTIIGTGFIVDERGIVITNRHVAEALTNLPTHPQTGESSAFAMIFSDIVATNGSHEMLAYNVDIRGYDIPHSFTTGGQFYGAGIPDLAFILLNVRDVPALRLATEPNTLRIGMPIATAGFARGTRALVLYDKLVQATPLLRQGIVSSLYPFPCPQPHGFTIDVMIQGGASGSPIFVHNEPVVVGMLYGGPEHLVYDIYGRKTRIDMNITMALPSKMLSDALNQSLEATGTLDLTDVPSLNELRREGQPPHGATWDEIR
jgi:hypothetical protein